MREPEREVKEAEGEGQKEERERRVREKKRERKESGERESQLTYFNFLHWAIYFFGNFFHSLFVPLSSGLNIFLVEILF